MNWDEWMTYDSQFSFIKQLPALRNVHIRVNRSIMPCFVHMYETRERGEALDWEAWRWLVGSENPGVKVTVEVTKGVTRCAQWQFSDCKDTSKR